MNESSDRWLETARNMEASVLQRLRDDASQTEVAKALGVHKSTVNRLVNEHGPGLIRALAFLGFQLADANALLVPREDFKALTRFAVRHLEAIAPNESEGR
jgi:hypothetical protein